MNVLSRTCSPYLPPKLPYGVSGMQSGQRLCKAGESVGSGAFGRTVQAPDPLPFPTEYGEFSTALWLIHAAGQPRFKGPGSPDLFLDFRRTWDHRAPKHSGNGNDRMALCNTKGKPVVCIKCPKRLGQYGNEGLPLIWPG